MRAFVLNTSAAPFGHSGWLIGAFPVPPVISAWLGVGQETTRAVSVIPETNRHQGFPGFGFPHYRPVVRGGRVYLVHQGRFILRPDLESGELVPVALADHRPWHGWRTVPEMIAQAAAHHGIDSQSNEANAYTWSDTNGNGRMDPEEFRFYHSAPRPDRAFLDDQFNILFGYYSAWNHTYDTVNSRWLGFDYRSSLYATLPNDAPDGDVPAWDWSRIVLSEAKVPEDPLGLWQRISGTPFTHSDGRVDVLMRAGGGSLDEVRVYARRLTAGEVQSLSRNSVEFE
jgi:hypothetical protein